MLGSSLTSVRCLRANAVTSLLSRRQTRFNSTTRPSFDFKSTFKLVNPPIKKWSIGDGLPTEHTHWNEDVVNSKRMSWDLTKPENMRQASVWSFNAIWLFLAWN